MYTSNKERYKSIPIRGQLHINCRSMYGTENLMFPPFSDRSIFLTNLYWDSILYIVQPIFIINPPHAEMMQLCKACKFRSKSKILPFFTPSLMNNATGIFVFTQRMQVVDMVRHTGSGATSWSTLATRGLRSLPYVPITQMLKIPSDDDKRFF